MADEVQVFEMIAGRQPTPVNFVAKQTLTIGGAASSAFNRSTTAVRIVSTTGCVVEFGAAPDGLGNFFPIVAGQQYDFEVVAGQKVIAAAGTATAPVVSIASGGATGTEYTEDAAASANPTGPVLLAVRRDVLVSTEVSAENDNIAAKADAYGRVHVNAGSPVDLFTVTPTVLNADAYDAGDVVFDSTVITNAVRVLGGQALLQSVVVADKDDQKAQLRLVFLDSNVSLGTADSAPSISDANTLKVLGTVEVAAADYIDLGGASVATVKSIGLLLEADAASRDIYVAAFTSGTPTYTTGGLQLRIGLLQA